MLHGFPVFPWSDFANVESAVETFFKNNVINIFMNCNTSGARFDFEGILHTDIKTGLSFNGDLVRISPPFFTDRAQKSRNVLFT